MREPTKKELMDELADLRLRLEEAEDTLNAIRRGDLVQDRRTVGRESGAHPAFRIYFGKKFPVAFRRETVKKDLPAGTKARIYSNRM